jgi:hypothetical protein
VGTDAPPCNMHALIPWAWSLQGEEDDGHAESHGYAAEQEGQDDQLAVQRVTGRDAKAKGPEDTRRLQNLLQSQASASENGVGVGPWRGGGDVDHGDVGRRGRREEEEGTERSIGQHRVPLRAHYGLSFASFFLSFA